MSDDSFGPSRSSARVGLFGVTLRPTHHLPSPSLVTCTRPTRPLAVPFLPCGAHTRPCLSSCFSLRIHVIHRLTQPLLQISPAICRRSPSRLSLPHIHVRRRAPTCPPSDPRLLLSITVAQNRRCLHSNVSPPALLPLCRLPHRSSCVRARSISPSYPHSPLPCHSNAFHHVRPSGPSHAAIRRLHSNTMPVMRTRTWHLPRSRLPCLTRFHTRTIAPPSRTRTCSQSATALAILARAPLAPSRRSRLP